MKRSILEARITVHRLSLSPVSVRALYALSRYDLIVFTSKNARECFARALRERGISLPERARIVHVGPRMDLLAIPVRNTHILFPRSALAPFDIVRRLRARGATVRVLPLYTVSSVPLSLAQKRSLARGKVRQIRFRSPSGVFGFMRQLRKNERRGVCSIPARCIGKTTARAARAAGFKNVFI